MRDFWACIGNRHEAKNAFIGGEDMIDRDIAIGVAVHLNTRAMHPLAPCVQDFLSFGHIAAVAVAAGIRDADGHGAFGERSVRRVLAGRTEANPLIAKTGRHAAAQHGLELRPLRLITDPMQQPAGRAHLPPS